MTGLKNVRRRRDDALSRIDWQALERLLAAYYRDLGWWVEHCGTGAGASHFDGGVDLRLRRDAEVVLVQCKHWNAKQVTHNAVHELLGVMVNEGATGAILISSGEFTNAAIAAAQRNGLVTLIDGDGLRGMLGALPDDPDVHDPFVAAFAPATAQRVGRRADGWLWLIALICAVGFVWMVREMLDRTADTAGEPPPPSASAPRPVIILHEPRAVDAAPVEAAPAAAPPPRPPTEAEIRASQRKADEAMRVIEESTPEM